MRFTGRTIVIEKPAAVAGTGDHAETPINVQLLNPFFGQEFQFHDVENKPVFDGAGQPVMSMSPGMGIGVYQQTQNSMPVFFVPLKVEIHGAWYHSQFIEDGPLGQLVKGSSTYIYGIQLDEQFQDTPYNEVCEKLADMPLEEMRARGYLATKEPIAEGELPGDFFHEVDGRDLPNSTIYKTATVLFRNYRRTSTRDNAVRDKFYLTFTPRDGYARNRVERKSGGYYYPQIDAYVEPMVNWVQNFVLKANTSPDLSQEDKDDLTLCFKPIEEGGYLPTQQSPNDAGNKQIQQMGGAPGGAPNAAGGTDTKANVNAQLEAIKAKQLAEAAAAAETATDDAPLDDEAVVA